MQINATSSPVIATQALKTSNNLPPNKVQHSQPTQTRTTIRELAQSIDPSNMNRNDARAIADALHEAGDFELASSFFVQSIVLVRENGNLRNATESDAIMNEKFNMFDSLKGQIEFNKNHNIPTEALEDVEHFLQKLQIPKVTPRVDTYT